MYCKECKDDGDCDRQRHDEENRRKGVGAVFIGDRLVGCSKYDDNPRKVLIMQTKERI